MSVRARRSREIRPWTAFAGLFGGASPHKASTSDSRGTVRPAASSSTARTAFSAGDPKGRG